MSTEFNKHFKTIHAKAPIRMDLSGGTLDIWPLYLLIDPALTINLAIDRFAETKIEILSPTAEKKAGGISLISEDQNVEAETTWDELSSFKARPELHLAAQLLQYFQKEKDKSKAILSFEGAPSPQETHFQITTLSRSPAGAGLGGSSALAITIVGALYQWAFPKEAVDIAQQGEHLIEITRDIETQILGVPAGLQDYYGAVYGGLQALKWGVAKNDREVFSLEILKGLSERLLLFYSGKSRNSGINNWQLFKDCIDDAESDARRKFAEIGNATSALRMALCEKNWEKVGQAIASEWSTRKTLAPGISTPEIDEAFEKGKSLGAVAGKICGAGGGGCFFLYLADPKEESKIAIIEELEKAEITHLLFGFSEAGLQVEVKHGS
jgi:D-glycero-alpha-D-manno-heptose-7-phosphate kinase